MPFADSPGFYGLYYKTIKAGMFPLFGNRQTLFCTADDRIAPGQLVGKGIFGVWNFKSDLCILTSLRETDG
jgi:hypothetical protein